jgi:putative alpha-1,2-mannosidase
VEVTGEVPLDMTGLVGMYAHGNEPSHHVAYLYEYAGAPHKTQEPVRDLLDHQYDNQPDGLSGNEDCGQMSAWYVISALGFYAVNPASGSYVFGSLNGKPYDKIWFNHRAISEGSKLIFKMGSQPSRTFATSSDAAPPRSSTALN